MPLPTVNVFWFRRDLRLHDNAGLYHALRSGLPVVPVFIFDTYILDDLENRADRRVEFIHHAISALNVLLKTYGSTIDVTYGTPEDTFKRLLERYHVNTVYTNEDYEQYAIDRDAAISQLLQAKNSSLKAYKDHVIFSKSEVVKDDGKPYTVFTPYSRKWKALLNDFFLKSYPVEKYLKNLYKQAPREVPSLSSMGFKEVNEPFPSAEVEIALMKSYKVNRDFPGIAGTSRIGVHLRFGTISIRQLASTALKNGETYLNELIWRDFYQMVLWQFPQVRVGKAFKPEYDRIQWRNNEKEFDAWCTGKTGYPIVDAGMRELHGTGYMHNRVRMVVASFLTKHLLIDWRWGEAYFAKKLLDFDYASNNGGWQWAAGSGCDAAPYFRIFNPALQTQKFDKDLKYIRKWVSELDSFSYPLPIVMHEVARERCLKVYKAALSKEE
ncbi:MAG: deoxyribodipyrimidine photo-lyase [Chitinophagaceae bacterium]|nr:deoxyribodipyrimidine photo-lyase [Chitinophagaceae bacterium]